jgi:hypothetical protein
MVDKYQKPSDTTAVQGLLDRTAVCTHLQLNCLTYKNSTLYVISPRVSGPRRTFLQPSLNVVPKTCNAFGIKQGDPDSRQTEITVRDALTAGTRTE